MKHVSIMGNGVTIPLGRQDLSDSLAFVPVAMSEEDMTISAELLKLPLCKSNEVFRCSAQTVRVIPTLRQIRRHGAGVYESLSQVFVDGINWQELRGIKTELLTAYLLARALEAPRIRWYFLQGVQHPLVSPKVIECFSRNGVELCFKPQR